MDQLIYIIFIEFHDLFIFWTNKERIIEFTLILVCEE